MTFITENGTIYEIDKPSMTWARLQKTARSGPTRRESGKLTVWPTITIGKPAMLQDDDLLPIPGSFAHFVVTSNVVSVERSEDD